MHQKNSGTAMKKYCPSVSTRSLAAPTWVAEWMPSAMPMIATSTMEIPASTADRPSASRISGPAGRSMVSDMPKSPRSSPLNQRQYCTGSGSFRPSRASSVAIASGVAYSPRIMWATEPGRMCTTAKTSSVIAQSTKASAASRRRRKPAIPPQPMLPNRRSNHRIGWVFTSRTALR